MHETLARPVPGSAAASPAPAPRALPAVVRRALAEPAAPVAPGVRRALGHDYARVRVAPAPAGESVARGDAAERQADDAARCASDGAREADPAAEDAVGRVRLHAGPHAADAARALHARAFTVGRDVVLGAGEHAPETARGRGLLAHEVAHVAQADAAGGAAPLRRDVVTDPVTRRATGYEFRVGTELPEAFATEAQARVADGALSDADIRALVKQAVDRRGTVNDHERMFMAGLRDAANVTAFQAVRVAAGAAVTFPVASIRANHAHVLNVDRQGLPASVTTRQAAAATALGSLDLGGTFKALAEAEDAAAADIVKQAGPLRAQATALVAYARANFVPMVAVLEAMHAAASDSTPSDRAMAGAVYAVAAVAGLGVAGDVRAGRVKVDALIPRAFRRLPGVGANVMAAYVTAAQGSGMKGDTMYLQTAFDITDTSQRSTLVHELDHAVADRASSPTGTVTFPNKVGLELRAYRAQARYILTQMEGQSAAERAATAARVAADQSSMVYGAALLEAQTDAARFQPLAEILFGVAPGTLARTPAQVGAMIALPAATIRTAVEADIARAYGLAPGDPGVTEGLAGESILHWIDRI
jgi:hypothetical protein